MSVRAAIVAGAASLVASCSAALAAAQGLEETIPAAIAEQSCLALAASTVGLPDLVRADPVIGIPESWPEGRVGLPPPHIEFRTETETFNRLYEFATAAGTIYGAGRAAATEPWRELPLPPCFAGQVDSISLDDDEMIALDTREPHLHDGQRAQGARRSSTGRSRWGTPFWTRARATRCRVGVKAWSWSVVSPLEDETWTDPAGNRTAIGAGKVSHIWGLRARRAAADLLGPLAAARRELRDVRAAPRPFPGA